MTNDSTHIIHRQRYEITVATQQQGRQVQQQLQQFNLQHLLPELNSRLNEWFAKKEELVTIDKIEIDLGQIQSNIASGEWLEKIIHQLEQKVTPFISKQAGEVTTHQNEINLQKTSTAIYAIDAFLFFLKNGLLPQASIYHSVAEIIKALQQMNSNELENLKGKLVAEINAFALQRLAMLPTGHVYFIAHLFLPELSTEAWKSWLTEIDEKSRKHTVSDAGLHLGLIKNQHVIFLVHHLIATIAKEQKTTWADAKQLVEVHTGKWLNERLPSSDDHKKKAQLLEEEKELEKELTQQDNELIANDGVFITYAGVCLLSPYLPMFFKALHMVNGSDFINTHLQQKAICLLHFLATGEEELSEEKLVLAKLLCGWPLQMPLNEKINLTEAEKQEANNLLLSVIEHWQALKSTSPDGLRQSFLQRSGKLSNKEDSFLLQVENQSIDILLEYVPWQFRFIKLPWVKKNIMVEWY